MNRYYWNEGECSLRMTFKDAVDPVTGKVTSYDHYEWERTNTREEWAAFMIGAVEVPGLLWHLKKKAKLEGELEMAQSKLKSAEWSLMNYLERYATELDLSLSHKIETEAKP